MNQVTYQEIPGGMNGCKATVQEMLKMAVKYSGNFEFIRKMRNMVAGVNPRDPIALANRIFWWVKQNIRFVHDPTYFELIQSPLVTIEEKAGDCDDFSILILSGNYVVGNDARLATIGRTKKMLDHVFVEVEDKQGKWIAYDAVVPCSKPGWHPPVYEIKEVWYPKEHTPDGLSVRVDCCMSDFSGFSGIFDKIYEEIKRFERRAREEVKRVAARIEAEVQRIERSIREEVSRVARRVIEEKRRVSGKIAEEFTRWETKYGMQGKWMVFGSKVLLFGVAGGFPGMDIALQMVDNPFKMDEEELKMFAHLAAVVGSTVLTIVTLGSATGLLIASVISLADTAVAAYELKEAIEARKALIKELKAQNIAFGAEERTAREAIRKLEVDMAVLNEILAFQADIGSDIKEYEQVESDRLDKLAIDLGRGTDAEIEQFQAQRDAAYRNFRDNIIGIIQKERESLEVKIENIDKKLGKYESDFKFKTEHPILYAVDEAASDLEEDIEEIAAMARSAGRNIVEKFNLEKLV